MEGRRIHGDGIEHEQDYIRERLDEVGGANDFAKASDVLEQELHDLQSRSGSGAAPSSGGDLDALDAQAQLPTERMEHVQSLDAVANSLVDGEQLTPDAEARARVIQSTGGGTTGS